MGLSATAYSVPLSEAAGKSSRQEVTPGRLCRHAAGAATAGRSTDPPNRSTPGAGPSAGSSKGPPTTDVSMQATGPPWETIRRRGGGGRHDGSGPRVPNEEDAMKNRHGHV